MEGLTILLRGKALFLFPCVHGLNVLPEIAQVLGGAVQLCTLTFSVFRDMLLSEASSLPVSDVMSLAAVAAFDVGKGFFFVLRRGGSVLCSGS
ncbi:MAG: hypothetical protein PHY12_08375 [Eubacteriales bacterium]|nr:hypothetical protein [Eubacteriales bacterium]